MSRRLPVHRRFFVKVDPVGHPLGCWMWTSVKSEKGYGLFGLGGRNHRAHRLAYEWFVGPIPAGLVIDHLCRNRSCVNPAHMEPVTVRENVLRGVGLCAVNARKTSCKRGHEFTPENTIVLANGRACRTCVAAKAKVRSAAKKRADAHLVAIAEADHARTASVA